MPETTLLGLELQGGGFSLSPWAARGIQMSLGPIDGAGQILRDINGNLVDLSNDQFKKLKAHISCSDQESPGFGVVESTDAQAVWPGSVFTVICLPGLGSSDPVTLTMMVMAPGWQINRDEYEAVTDWSIDLEQT